MCYACGQLRVALNGDVDYGLQSGMPAVRPRLVLMRRQPQSWRRSEQPVSEAKSKWIYRRDAESFWFI